MTYLFTLTAIPNKWEKLVLKNEKQLSSYYYLGIRLIIVMLTFYGNVPYVNKISQLWCSGLQYSVDLRWLPTFWRNTSPPSSEHDGEDTFLQNTGNHLQRLRSIIIHKTISDNSATIRTSDLKTAQHCTLFYKLHLSQLAVIVHTLNYWSQLS